jgi:hypothetical protein
MQPGRPAGDNLKQTGRTTRGDANLGERRVDDVREVWLKADVREAEHRKNLVHFVVAIVDIKILKGVAGRRGE